MLGGMETLPHDRRTSLVKQYDGLAVSLARQFPTNREWRDDLEQVARVGLLRAAERFDPSRSRPFTAFARATIVGELKRHMRDHTWSIRMPRSLHDCYLEVARALDDLTQELGRSPRVAEIAARTGFPDERVLEALEVRDPLPLELPHTSGQSFEPVHRDASTDRQHDEALLASLLDRLDDRRRMVIELYFGEGLSQREIGLRLGVSQMTISRLLHTALQQMRRQADAA